MSLSTEARHYISKTLCQAIPVKYFIRARKTKGPGAEAAETVNGKRCLYAPWTP